MIKKGTKSRNVGILLIAWLLGHVAMMLWTSKSNEIGRQDVVVVFGNTVHPNGELSKRLKARLDQALEIYHNHHSKVFVSGALGSEGHLEAEVMRDYLVSKGVLEKEIIVDNLGVNTRATAINAANIFSKDEYLVLVSQYHHGLRAKLAFRQQGFDRIEFSAADFKERKDLFSIIREFVGFYAYLLHFK
jgi:vancomycin permeability regulator SanA